jgi:aspartate dehydrogenase
MSAAALVDAQFRQQLITEATHHQCEVTVASGAIGGLDALRAARQSGTLDEVIYTSTKHPRSLMGAPYLVANGIDISNLNTHQVLYDGPAGDAMQAFPQNVNVAAAVSLAGLGFERTRVRVIADPATQRTTHALMARGGFGVLQLQLESSPHPANPKTSYLACLGAISALAYRQSPFKVGG